MRRSSGAQPPPIAAPPHPTMTVENRIQPLPVPRTTPPKSPFGRWFLADHSAAEHGRPHTRPWHQVLWLTGVDYFSTLGYQPGIALLAAGALAPIATAILVLVTLLCAVPVYAQVAKRSWAGQGSIAMLENLLPRWGGKFFVVALLGFAATDFVITMTLSAADAAEHAIHNPLLHPFIGEARVTLTLGLLAALAFVFLSGFGEAIRIAMLVAAPYILLNLVVLARGLYEVAQHPELFSQWRLDLFASHPDWPALLLAALLVFPRLALGLSGFETGVAVMPLVDSDGDVDFERGIPTGRIRGTRKLLLAAALIMSGMLVLSSAVTTLLIPPAAYAEHGPAAGRAIAYLAHDLLGHAFGTVYDLWTIAILWFAGASALAGLLNILPRYLPRFGMAPHWTSYHRPLVLVLFVVAGLVTVIFHADVEKQAGAYATGVLVLMLSAGIAVSLALWKEFRAAHGLRTRVAAFAKSGFFWLVAAMFAFTLIDNVIVRPEGVWIAACFVLAILSIGAFSRWKRSTELRVSDVGFADPESARLWNEIVGHKVNLVPLRGWSRAARERKATEIRRHYRVEGPLAFLHVYLLDNRSEFLSPLSVRVTREDEDYFLEVSGALAIANTIAYISELLDPICLFLGLTGRNLMQQAVRYLLWGEGETGIMVYRILLRYWEWTPDADVKPRIFLMSEEDLDVARHAQATS
jgi:hypothetical protein